MTNNLILFIFALIAAINLDAQNQVKKSSLTLNLSLLKNVVASNTDLRLKIVIKNVSDSGCKVYNQIVEGYEFDQFTNFNLVVEKKVGHDYNKYSNRTMYQMLPGNDTVDEIGRSVISPNDSFVLYFHVDNSYVFPTGKYRLKGIYRNKIFTKQKIESHWIYFEVLKDIYIKKYD